MAVKKSQIEDKSIKPDKEIDSSLPEKKDDKKERGKEYN